MPRGEYAQTPGGGRIDFDRPVADFDVGDITLGGSISGTALSNFSGSGMTYTVDVTGLVGAGTVCIEVAAGVAHDSGGIANTASGASCYTVVGSAGDFDRDGDVDMSDFAVFQACFNGPNRPYAGTGCAGADADHDADVDMSDFAVFQACFNGPNRPPACE